MLPTTGRIKIRRKKNVLQKKRARPHVNPVPQQENEGRIGVGQKTHSGSDTDAEIYMAEKEQHLRRWLLCCAWMILIYVGSSIPGERLPDFAWNYIHGVVHFFEFFILGILCTRATRGSFRDVNVKILYLFAFLFSVLFAISNELHQYSVPGRYMEIGDIITDTLGAFFGIMIYVRITCLYDSKRHGYAL